MLVSAALSASGNPARILEAVGSGRVVLVVSPQLLAELDEVLNRPKVAARLDGDALWFLRQVLAAAPVVEDPPVVAVSRDPKDDYLIALARQAVLTAWFRATRTSWCSTASCHRCHPRLPSLRTSAPERYRGAVTERWSGCS